MRKHTPTITGKILSSRFCLGTEEEALLMEGWTACYWIIVALHVAPLQVLKGFSVWVPFCTSLANNLQKRAVLARTS